jgi:hypothetical protein
MPLGGLRLRIIREADHLARTREKKILYKNYQGNLKVCRTLGRHNLCGRVG